MVNINIKFSNRLLYTFIAVAVMILFSFGVYAYGGIYGNSSIMGHSIDELDAPLGCVADQVMKWNGTAWGCSTDTSCNVSDSCSQVCIGTDCQTSWPSGGGSSLWTQSGSNIYYNSGNVSIGTTNSNAHLNIAGDYNQDIFVIDTQPGGLNSLRVDKFGKVGVYITSTATESTLTAALNVQSSLKIIQYSGSLMSCTAERKGTLHVYDNKLYFCGAGGNTLIAN